jgi:uncharacterized protein
VRPRRQWPALLCGPSASPLEVSLRRRLRPYNRMARDPYLSYTFGGEPKLRVGSGQGRAEPAKAWRGLCAEAQLAFLDPSRVIAKDVSHSKGEPRFYCFGQTGDGVLTVRFTYRGEVIRIIGAGYWRRGKRIYEAQSKVSRRALGTS